MNVWVITVGEPLPINGGNERLLRSGLLCRILVARGHSVTWWTSTFQHWLKRHFAVADHVAEIGPHFKIRMLHGCGYDSNVSLARLIDHWQIARKFRAQAAGLERPDVILCSLPTLELSDEAVRYGRTMSVPTIIDVRDLWPDIFLELAPTVARPIVRLMLLPYFHLARRALAGASAIVAINEGFVNWGLTRAARHPTGFDRAFPMAYPSAEPPPDQQRVAREFWRAHGVSESDGTFKAIFFGTIGRQFQFEPVIEAARALSKSEIRFIICGAGDLLEGLRAQTRDVPNVLLPGWIGAAEIWTLMRMAHAGLAPYHDEPSFTHSLPNKIFEYLSAGLPIVSSLPGALENLLSEYTCGLTYPNRDATALRGALERLLVDPAARLEMAHNAKALFDSRFQAEVVYSDMISHIEAVANATIVTKT